MGKRKEFSPAWSGNLMRKEQLGIPGVSTPNTADLSLAACQDWCLQRWRGQGDKGSGHSGTWAGLQQQWLDGMQ